MITQRPIVVIGASTLLTVSALTAIVSGKGSFEQGARPQHQVPAARQVPVGDGPTLPAAIDGQLLSFKRQLTGPSDEAIRITTIDSGRSRYLPFWVGKASAVYLESASLTKSGDVLVAGEYTTEADGAAVLRAFRQQPGAQWAFGGGRLPGSSLTNFVAAISSDGTTRFVVDLADYTPQHLCASSDGTFWTVGQSWPSEIRGGDAFNYAVVRRFSAEGRVIGRYVPRPSLGQAPMVLNYHAVQPNAAAAFIRCGEGVTVAYLTRSPQGTALFEIDHATGDIRSRVVRQQLPGMITGFVLVSNETLYASVGPRPVTRQKAVGAESSQAVPASAIERRKQLQGVYRLQLSSPAARWSLVRANDSGYSYVLLGAAGTQVVHLRRADKQTSRDNLNVLLSPFE